MRTGGIIAIVLLGLAAMAAFAVVLFGDLVGGPPVEQQQSEYDRMRAEREQERQQLIDDCIVQSGKVASDVSVRARCELAHPVLPRR